jgi:cysteine synthase A
MSITSLVQLPSPGENNQIFAKLEYESPTGSHYGRVYPVLLSQLEAQGKIVPGVSTLVETTTGNAGISFAYFGWQMGYRCVVFAPEGLPEKRLEMIKLYCAELRLSPKEKYIVGASEAMREFLIAHREKKNGVRLFYSPNHSQQAVSCTTLEPIAEEAILQSGGSFDCFIGAAGNGSTLKGIGTVLRRNNPAVRIIAFDPIEAPVATALKTGCGPAEAPQLHTMYGAGAWGINFPHLTDAVANLVDEVQVIKESQWHLTHVILKLLGYGVGHTSAAAYFLAHHYCQTRTNQKVLIVFYDRLERYL